MQMGLSGAETAMVATAIGALLEEVAAASRGGEHPDARAARWFQLLASTMRLAASDLSATPHRPSLARQAAKLDAYARRLDARGGRHLRLVRR